jgi:hypothetical protein
MLDALWSVEFRSSTQTGAGVVVLNQGRILGGDAQYFYVGSYRLEGAIAKATFTIQHYAGAAHTVFGNAQQLVIEVSGKPAQDSFELRGHVLGAPKATLTVRLQRRAELQ